MQGELEVVHQAKPLQLAVDRLQLDPSLLGMGAQLHHGVDLQLKHLQVCHRVAVAAGPEGLELARVEQGLNHPVFLGEVMGQPLRLVVHGELQLLTGTEGQGHGLLAGAA